MYPRTCKRRYEVSVTQTESKKRTRPAPLGHQKRPLFAKRMIVGGQPGVFIPLLPTVDVEKIEDWLTNVDSVQNKPEERLAS